MFIGTLLSGFIDAFVPSETIEKVLPRNQIAAIALSGVLGVVFPMCECGVVPVIRRLIRKGLPVSCALTYLLAAPIVNPIVALSTFAAFRGQHPGMVTSMRLLMGFGVACVCGMIVQRIPSRALLNRPMLASLGKRPVSSRAQVQHAREPALAVAYAGVPAKEISFSRSFPPKRLCICTMKRMTKSASDRKLSARSVVPRSIFSTLDFI